MAILHKAIKSKPWIVRYKEPWSGKARTKSFSTEAEAQSFDAAQSQVFDRERAIIKATKRRRKRQAAPSITVADVIDRYLDSLTNLRTRKSCAHHLKSIRDIFGTRKAHCMTLEDMDSFLKVQHERGVGRTTANRRAGLLRTACNHAVRWGLLSVNPLASMRLAAQPRQTPDPPTLHEAKLIYNSASEHVQRVVLLGLATGARIGPSELFRLRWSDVDLEHALLRMPQAAKGARAEGRTVPIRRDVLDQLQSWSIQDAAIQCPLVINYHGKSVRNINHAWRKALQRAGIERRIRPYDLRHAFASHALDAGADLKSVADIMGHADEAMIVRFYRHTNPETLRAATEAAPGLNSTKENIHMESNEIVYKINDGRLWDVEEARYVTEAPASKQVITLYSNGKPGGEDYLKRTLVFYGYAVGPELKTLDEVKAEKLAEINEKCDAALKAMTPTYPDRELLTFDQQKQEALAYTSDPSSPCPLLSPLAAARGITLELLCQKVIAKATAFSAISGTLIGQRQAYEDQLELCETKEAVAAIQPVYSLESEGNA